jgi:hypothetical protein
MVNNDDIRRYEAQRIKIIQPFSFFCICIHAGATS